MEPRAHASTNTLRIGDRAQSIGLAAALGLTYAAIGAPVVAGGGQTAASLAVAALLAVTLIALTVIDLGTLRLPDVLTLPLIAAGLALAALDSADAALWHTGSAALGGLTLVAVAWLYRRSRGRDGLGMGDAKLFAAAGAWVGAEGLASVLLVACALALAVALGWRLRDRSVGGASMLPFGPFLAIGLWVVWLHGPLA